MNQELLKDFFEYNLWANQRLIHDLKNIGDRYDQPIQISFGSIHHLLTHLAYYDAKIYEKITGQPPSYKIESTLPKEKLFQVLKDYSNRWLELIQSLDISPGTINTLITLCHHNTYHRGQITAALSMMNFKISSLDIYLYQSE